MKKFLLYSYTIVITIVAFVSIMFNITFVESINVANDTKEAISKTVETTKNKTSELAGDASELAHDASLKARSVCGKYAFTKKVCGTAEGVEPETQAAQ